MTSSLLPFLASGDLQNKKNTNKLFGSFSFFQIYSLPFFLDLFHCRSDFFIFFSSIPGSWQLWRELSVVVTVSKVFTLVGGSGGWP